MGVADHAATSANLSRTDRIHLVSENQRRGSQLFIVIGGNVEALSVDANVIRIAHVLDRDVETIQPRQQRDRLPIDRFAVQRLRQQLGRLLDLDRIFKGLHSLVRQGRDLTQNVYNPFGYTVFVTNVTSRFLICTVTGTRTVLDVTLTKSVRTSKGKIGPLINLCSLIKLSRSLNLIGGGAKSWLPVRCGQTASPAETTPTDPYPVFRSRPRSDHLS